jgi:hypothetical protein
VVSFPTPRHPTAGYSLNIGLADSAPVAVTRRLATVKCCTTVRLLEVSPFHQKDWPRITGKVARLLLIAAPNCGTTEDLKSLAVGPSAQGSQPRDDSSALSLCWDRVALNEFCDCLAGNADGPPAVHTGKMFSPQKPCPDGGDFKV